MILVYSSTRLQVLHIIIYSCRSSLLSDLLQHLRLHPLPSLHHLRVRCEDDSYVRALTTFLPQCANLRTLYYERTWERDVPENVEEMWEAVVRRCRNLEEVRVRGVYSFELRDRLMSVLGKLSEKEGIQALKLRRIVEVNWYGQEEDCTEEVKHLLLALQ